MTITVKHAALIHAIEAARKEHIDAVENGYADLAVKLSQAFVARMVGNEKESRLLLNAALDIEFDLTGDTALLTELSEEWGVDYERDK